MNNIITIYGKPKEIGKIIPKLSKKIKFVLELSNLSIYGFSTIIFRTNVSLWWCIPDHEAGCVMFGSSFVGLSGQNSWPPPDPQHGWVFSDGLGRVYPDGWPMIKSMLMWCYVTAWSHEMKLKYTFYPCLMHKLARGSGLRARASRRGSIRWW